jgi:hypothetical protein
MIMDEKNEIQVVDFEKLPIDYSDTGVTEAVLTKLKEDYGVAPDCSTKEGYAIAKAGLTLLRTLRVKIEAKRKKNNAGAVSYKKRNDGEAAGYISFIVALEEPMKAGKQVQDAIKEEEKRVKAEKEKERVAAIEKDINTIRNVVLDCHGKTSLELSGIIGSLEETEIALDRFAEHTPIAEAAKIEAIEKLEEMRDQALITEKADEERIAEDARLVAEREKLEEERKIEDKRLDDEREKLRLEGLEAGRISKIKDKIQAIKDRGAYDPDATAEKILGRIHVLENTRASKEVFEEFTEDAHMACGLALSALKDFHTVRVEKERLTAVAAEEAIKADEEAAELEASNTEAPEEEPLSGEDDEVVDAEFVEEENQVDAVKTNEDIEFADRMAFVDALVKLFPAVPTPTANGIYRAMKEGKIPFKFIGGE